MPVTTVAELVDLLRRSELLTPEQLNEVATLGASDPQTLARRIFRRGWVTRWQALTLLEGRCQFFIGRYKLLELIGSGGMGAVFKAVRPDIGRIVAVKVLKPKLLRKSSGVPRFLREIRSAASLDHPNIVQAYDADNVNDTYILVMEYVDGRDLKSYITARDVPSIPWLCEVMRQAALGLQHAADRGTVHRDIKPANLMVAHPEQGGVPVVKILDFGLARFASETEEDEGLTRVGQAVGTPDYISPEQAQNSRSADIRADIYSLGCTFFELLTGQVPFPIESLTEKLVARVRSDAPRARSIRPDIPPEIDEILAKMMHRDPAQRYQTAAQLARALAPYSMTAGLLPADGGSADDQPISDWKVNDDSVYGQFLDTLHAGTGTGDRSTSSTDSVAVSRGGPRFRAGPILAAIAIVAVLLALFFQASRIPPAPGGRNVRESEDAAEAAGPVEPAPGIVTATALLKLGATLLVAAPDEAPAVTEWPPLEPGGDPRRIAEINNAAQLPSRAEDILGVEFRLSPHVTNVTLGRLKELPKLEHLRLVGCRISDHGLVDLAELTQLRVLELSDMPISDIGLRSLKPLERIEELTLSRTPVTGEGLAHLGQLTGLRQLNLDYTGVNGSSLPHVQKFSRLEDLSLNGNKFPPAALTALEPLEQLRMLHLKATSLNEQSVQRLLRKNPGLKVEF